MARKATKADIGLIGLAVMGENLILNMESKGYTVACFNRTVEKVDAFVKDHQRHAVEKQLLHIDFLAVEAGKKLHAHVRIILKGSPIGVKEGGVLETPQHDIEVECDPSVLPEKIEIDVSSLGVNHSFHVRDLPALKDVKVLTSPDMVLASVKFARGEAAPAAETAEPAVEAAATAAAAPATEAKA